MQARRQESVQCFSATDATSMSASPRTISNINSRRTSLCVFKQKADCKEANIPFSTDTTCASNWQTRPSDRRQYQMDKPDDTRHPMGLPVEATHRRGRTPSQEARHAKHKIARDDCTRSRARPICEDALYDSPIDTRRGRCARNECPPRSSLMHAFLDSLLTNLKDCTAASSSRRS